MLNIVVGKKSYHFRPQIVDIILYGLVSGIFAVIAFVIIQTVVTGPPETLEEAAVSGAGSYQARCLLYLEEYGREGEYDAGMGTYSASPKCKAVIGGKIIEIPSTEWNIR